jgi:hypothetical protein
MREILFKPAGAVTLTPAEAPAVFDMPPPDDKARDTVISNASGEIVFLRFGAHQAIVHQGHADFSLFKAHALSIAPGHEILLRHDDGGNGTAASAATKVTLCGRNSVTIQRGTAVEQMIFPAAR